MKATDKQAYLGSDEFGELIERARALTAECEHRGRYAQVIVAQTSGGNMVTTVVSDATDSEDADMRGFLDALSESGDTELVRLVCMWRLDNWLDLPSYAFRERLCALNPANSDTQMLLAGERSCIVKRIGQTLAPPRNCTAGGAQ